MNYKPPMFKLVPGRKMDSGLRLVHALRRLKNEFGACCLKLSTEDAGMSFDQIQYWTELVEGVLPVMVKIGGPNARNDIKQLVSFNIDGLIAPMVESSYGLENFLAAVRDFTTPLQMQRLAKQINIETVTAIEQLDYILDCREARLLDEITIGCSDLSKSLKKDRMHPEVKNRVNEAVRKIKGKKINVSIGGGIAPDNIHLLLSEIQPNKFNTRMVTFRVNSGESYQSAVAETLRFELEMLKHDFKQGFISLDEEKFRARELKKRLAEV